MKLFRIALIASALTVAVPQQTHCFGDQIYQTCQSYSKIALREFVPLVKSLVLVSAPALILYTICTYIGPVGKLYKKGTIQETFDSIAGNESIKEDINDIADYLQNPDKYKNIGTNPPHGLLMHGPPGTGKTSLARALAGQSLCSFIAITGSELNSAGSGPFTQNKGAARVKKLFKQARSHAPCIIFIDEIDATDYEVQRQLLTEMDGFEKHNELVIVIGATNNILKVTAPLLRPGRFDRVVKVDLPDLVDRKSILAFYANKVKMDLVVDLDIIAQMTYGFSGAELANLINEASIAALKAHKQQIDQTDLEKAFDILTAGKTKKIQRTQEERRIIAYHEAGHTLIAILLGNLCDPIFKVTIAEHEQSSGCTTIIPSNKIVSKDKLIATLKILYGGRAAEKLVFNTSLVGAASDLERAARLARDMVLDYGMSSAIGPRVFPTKESQQGRKLISQEIEKFLLDAYNAAYTMLSANRDKLDCIANALLAKETLSAKEVYELLGMNQPAKSSVLA